MKLLLRQHILQQLQREMNGARRREIGGLLLGEHVEGETFRLVDVTVQTTGGSEGHFIRDPAQHRAQLESFFAKTGADYTKFNYLGEWHSHPSFEPLPSDQDIRTMQSIVEDPAVGVNFLVLVIVRLSGRRRVQMSAMVFQANASPAPVAVEFDEADVNPTENPLVRFINWLFNSSPS